MEGSRSNYSTLGLVGQGQFGRVYCAVHRKTGHLVALKHLNRERLPTNQFLRELRFLLSLRHPHIVGCHTLEHTPTGRQLVLDYCEGGTLRSVMEQEIPLTLVEIITLIAEVLSALEQAHRQGIVHCDIKPENILLSLTADGWQAKVSDFGIARLSHDLDSTRTGATGSPAYMAPERFYYQYAEGSDLYALSIVLYELLLGDRPFSGSHDQLLVAHINQSIDLPDTLPPPLRQVLSRGLEKLMARRFQSATEMKAAILALPQALTEEQLQERFPKASVPASIGHFQSQKIIPLVGPCDQVLCSVENHPKSPLLLATGETTVYQWPMAPNSGMVYEPYPKYQWQFDSTIQQVIDSPAGAIALCGNVLYRLEPDHSPLPIVTFADRITLSPSQHRWIIAHSSVNPQHYWLLDILGKIPVSPCFFDVDMLAQPRRHTLFVDSRYIVIADVAQHTTTLKITTRWGKFLGDLELQTPVHQLVHSREPYQFLAQGGTQGQDLFVVKLKPFRVTRCRLEITPDWIGELIIGFVGVSKTGQLQVSNFQGQLIGRVDDLPLPTAISFSYPYHVWLATNQSDNPCLHCIDVRDLNLDIIF